MLAEGIWWGEHIWSKLLYSEMRWYCKDNDHIIASYLSGNLFDKMFQHCEDNAYIVIMISGYLIWTLCLSSSGTTLFCNVSWLLQRTKDYSDTTVFDWLTLRTSNRTLCSPLRFEAVRCYLYVTSWFGVGTLCSNDVLYAEEHCTEDCGWSTSFLKSYATSFCVW